ncbi:MAG: hypothetical protein RLZZ450_6615 [Pseudomonadota bacterium]|jgi:hypothetical protein
MVGRLGYGLLLSLFCSLAAPAHGVTGESRFVGVHQLGVNRVSDKRRAGSVTITKRDQGLYLEGAARGEPYYLELAGTVTRVDERLLELDGELRGVPNMSWADEAPRARKTVGKFIFRVTKGRKFWRLYQVNGQDCVCDDNCGNDFCYVDFDLQTQPAQAQ